MTKDIKTDTKNIKTDKKQCHQDLNDGQQSRQITMYNKTDRYEFPKKLEHYEGR